MKNNILIILMFLAVLDGTYCAIWTIVEFIKYLIQYTVSLSSAIPLDIHFNWLSLEYTVIGFILAIVFAALVVLSELNIKNYKPKK